MNDLQRLMESSDDDLELALLRSPAAELPGSGGLEATALALGLAAPSIAALTGTLPGSSALGATLAAHASPVLAPPAAGALTAGASGAASSITSVSLAVLGKGLLGGALVSFVGLTTLDRTLGASSTEASRSSAAATSVARPLAPPAHPQPTALVGPVSPMVGADPAAPVAATPLSARTAPQRSDRAVTSEAPEEKSRPASAAFEPMTQPRAASTGSASATLASEIRTLDLARSALAASDLATARRMLDEYASRKPSPVLAPEAGLLRVRLLLAQGQRPAAAALARRLMIEHPESTHVDSLQRLAAEP